MSEKFPLNDTLSPINPQTWAELNENWDRIKSYFRHLQGQVNILAGGEEIDEVINRIDAAIVNATNATDTANQIIDTLNIELPKVLTVLENAETAIINAETATASAQSATSAANVATGNANDVTTAAVNATNETNIAKSAAETATINANAATTDALEAAELASNAKNEAVTATNDALSALTEMQKLINNFLHRGIWNSTTQYYKNNLASANGRTYIAKQDNLNKVVTDTVNWQLLADKGEKGDTGAALSILDQLMNESQLPQTGEAGQAYTISGDLYVWSENSNQWINVGNIKGEKGGDGLSAYQIALLDGFIGTESEWLESLKGERGEKGANGSDASVTKTNISNALGYTPANNEDLAELESDFSTHSVQTEQTLTNHESRLNQLESGSNTTKADVAGLNREVAYLKLKEDVSERLEGGTVFAEDFKGNRFGMTLDEINSNGFKIKNGKLIMVEDIPTNYSVTDTTVVASAYSTAGNGGRKLVRLSNGWLVAISKNGTNGAYLFADKRDGNGFTQLCWFGGNVNDFSIVSDGTTIKVLYANSADKNTFFCSIDAVSVSNTNQNPNAKTVAAGQTDVGNVSLAIDPKSGHLHAAWSSKNSTYPNSFNIRYAKSIDGGATWSTLEQVTNQSTTNSNYSNPIIIVLPNSNPHLVFSYDQTVNTFQTISYKWDGTKFVFQTIIYNGGTYVQSNPSAVVDKDGVIPVVWHGRDATHTSTDYIRFDKSTDMGVTWSTMKKLIPGKNGSITVDKNNKYIITYEDNGVIKQISSIDKGENWSAPVTIANGTNPSVLYDSNFGLGFTKTPVIYMSASAVKFTGEWSEMQEVPKTTATVVYNIPSTDYVGAFVQKTGNVSVTAFLNDTLMESELEVNEYQFEGSLATEAPAKLRLELSRASTANGEGDAITRILGGRS